ncbi:MAG: FkbM family methyltransferase [Bacteroidota bacterium]
MTKLVALILQKLAAPFFHLSKGLHRLSDRVLGYHKDQFRITLKEWYKIQGDNSLRVEYPLFDNSVVWDVGGFRGDWAAEILARYGCHLSIFEPVSAFGEILEKRFGRNQKVQLFFYGLSGKNEKVNFNVIEESSTSLLSKEPTKWQDQSFEEVELKSFSDCLAHHSPEGIDLIKVNIEGGEYDLLEHILEKDLASKIKFIQVQFHNFIPDAEKRMKSIQNKLRETHELTYQYPFVWESWARKEG